jgi:excisionase family DNA binding protein
MKDPATIAAKGSTVTEVAAEMKVNRGTVIRWINAGLVPAVRVGRRNYRLCLDDVRAAMIREA